MSYDAKFSLIPAAHSNQENPNSSAVLSYPRTEIAPNDYPIDAQANCWTVTPTRVRSWEVNRTSERKKLEEIFTKHSFTDFRWIDAQKIVVSQWVRMKCMFGCAEYGKRASCPPNVPTVAECERFFRDYKEAAIFHFEKRSINLRTVTLGQEELTRSSGNSNETYLSLAIQRPSCSTWTHAISAKTVQEQGPSASTRN